MVSVAKDHEVSRMLVGTYGMSFVSGMVDATTFLSVSTDNSLTTHLSGATLKAGVFLAESEYDRSWQLFMMIVSFFVGSLVTGILTRKAEFKTLKLLCSCLLATGGIFVLVGVLMVVGADGARYIACFGSGLQNSILTNITGFARTTHVTGTVTDIGILMGQGLNPETWKNTQHWAKCQALSILYGMFTLGGAVTVFFYDERYMGLEDYTMFVPAAMATVLGIVGHQQLWRDANKVQPLGSQTASTDLYVDIAQLSAATETATEHGCHVNTATRLGSMLKDLRSSALTSDNMPIWDAQTLVSTVISVHSAKQAFLGKLKSRQKEITGDELVALCDCIMKNTGMVKEIEILSPDLALLVELLSCSTSSELKESLDTPLANQENLYTPSEDSFAATLYSDTRGSGHWGGESNKCLGH